MSVQTEQEPRTRRDRPLMIGGIVILVVVALAIAVVIGGGRTATLDPASPEGVVQRYVSALLSGDTAAAISLATDIDDCEFQIQEPLEDDLRVTLGTVDIQGDRAVVDVSISWPSGDPVLDPYSSSQRARFHLIQVNGEWMIENSPWPFWVCNERP